MRESPEAVDLDEAIAEAEERQAKRVVILSDTVKHWNSFIRGLLSATTAWERYRTSRLENAIHVEEFPLEVQKMFVKANPHGDLDLIIEDIVTQPRLGEHLKTLFIQVN